MLLYYTVCCRITLYAAVLHCVLPYYTVCCPITLYAALLHCVLPYYTLLCLQITQTDCDHMFSTPTPNFRRSKDKNTAKLRSTTQGETDLNSLF